MKKIFKILSLVFIVIIALFFILGVIFPSVEYSNTITINKSLKEVDAVLMDESKLPLWLEGFVSSELISGEAGKVGAVSKIVFNENGSEVVIMETITKVIPNERLEMTFSNPMMVMDYSMSLKKESETKTKVESKSVAKGVGLFYKSLCKVIKSELVKQENKNLTNLKKVVEENTTKYFE